MCVRIAQYQSLFLYARSMGLLYTNFEHRASVAGLGEGCPVKTRESWFLEGNRVRGFAVAPLLVAGVLLLLIACGSPEPTSTPPPHRDPDPHPHPPPYRHPTSHRHADSGAHRHAPTYCHADASAHCHPHQHSRAHGNAYPCTDSDSLTDSRGQLRAGGRKEGRQAHHGGPGQHTTS